jgi:hypothetical protein
MASGPEMRSSRAASSIVSRMGLEKQRANKAAIKRWAALPPLP